MNETIWNYINKTADNHQVIEDWHAIAENLDGHINIDEFDHIHTTVIDYMNLHNLENIDVQYVGPPKRKVDMNKLQEIENKYLNNEYSWSSYVELMDKSDLVFLIETIKEKNREAV